MNTPAASTAGTRPDRARLAAQLDTAYFLLYGLTPDDAESVGQVPRT